MKALLLCLVVLGGCVAQEGRPLLAWTATVDGKEVRLGELLPKIQQQELTVTVHQEVELEPHERGRTLTLLVECFHGDVELFVDGRRAPSVGLREAGEHRFLIAADQTTKESLFFEMRGHHDWVTLTRGGFAAAPQLVVGAMTEPTASALFNDWVGIVGLSLLGLFVLLFGGMYMLDREQRDNGAVALLCVTTIPTMLGLQFAVIDDPAITGVSAAIGNAAMVWGIYSLLQLGRAPLGWIVGFAVLGLARLATIGAPLSWTIALDRYAGLIIVGWAVWAPVLLARAAWRSKHRVDAAIMCIGWTIALASYSVEYYIPMLRGVRFSGYAHVLPIAILAVGLSLATVLARRHVARWRDLESSTRELQHQVAERSRELAQALAKLSATPASLSIGATIAARYRVVRELGRGGMGTVFEVERTDDGQRLALKTLRGHVDAAAMARFAREAQIAAALDHPNLVPVRDVGIDESGALYLVMPLVAGGTLATECDRRGDATWAMPVLAQIASGLEALHARSIVHRDLKPANILLDGTTIRIADFGLASLDTGEQGLTRRADFFGTPRYMAPELAAGVADAEPASDIFAFGVIAFELLTSDYPFTEPPVLAKRDGKAIMRTTASMGPAIATLVDRCLELDPAKRPLAAELVAALRGLAKR